MYVHVGIYLFWCKGYRDAWVYRYCEQVGNVGKRCVVRVHCGVDSYYFDHDWL